MESLALLVFVILALLMLSGPFAIFLTSAWAQTLTEDHTIAQAMRRVFLVATSVINIFIAINLLYANIPFEDNYFDYILASSSLYYIDGEDKFERNVNEVLRVLKPGGWLIANFIVRSPDPNVVQESFILKDCTWNEDGSFIVKNDIYGIRNGYTMKCFRDKEELQEFLSVNFENIGIGCYYENHYGVQINGLISASQKI